MVQQADVREASLASNGLEQSWPREKDSWVEWFPTPAGPSSLWKAMPGLSWGGEDQQNLIKKFFVGTNS